jgi:hypothetical protein
MIPLNAVYKAYIVEPNEPNAMNAKNFEAEEQWTVRNDDDGTYTTTYAVTKMIYFQTANPKSAIQQALTHYTSNKFLLKDLYFVVVKRSDQQ